MSDQIGSGEANQTKRDESSPPDLFAARIAVTRETFPKLMRAFDLDVGCRPHVDMKPDGTGSLLVFATQESISELQAGGYSVEPGENVSELGRQRQGEIGEGDRFEGGRITPHGLGLKSGHGRG